MLKSRFVCLVGTVALLFSTLLTLGCGEGKTCDCCTERKDCEFGLKCVDLIGGSGKVCGSAGINYCSEDACSANSSSLYDGRIELSTPENNGTYAVVDAFKDLVEEDETPDGGMRK